MGQEEKHQKTNLTLVYVQRREALYVKFLYQMIYNSMQYSFKTSCYTAIAI